MQSKSFPPYNLLVTRKLVNILINSADTDEMPLFGYSLFITVFLHMNDDVVNVQTGLILFRVPFILVGSILGSILIVNLSHVWNTSIQYKSPEREKVIILAYVYVL